MTWKQQQDERNLRIHRSHLEDEARRQTELMREANHLAEKQAAAGSGGASTSSGDPVVAIVVFLVLAVVVAVIAIVVTYWAEILFAGVAVLAFHYRKPITRFVRRIAAACSGTEAEEEETEKPPEAQGICGKCHKPSMALAPFCIHCGSRITAPPPSSVVPSPIPPPILPPPQIKQIGRAHV